MAEGRLLNIEELDLNVIPDNETLTENDQYLVSFKTTEVGRDFSYNINYAELHFYNLENNRILSVGDFTDYKVSGESNNKAITVEPALDTIKKQYFQGDVRLQYNFYNNLFTRGSNPFGGELYIYEISGDRTELRLLPTNSDILTDSELSAFVNIIRTKLESSEFYDAFKLNFGDNRSRIAVNIELEEFDGNLGIIVKLYSPLPSAFGVKDRLRAVESVIDSKVYELTADVIEVSDDDIIFDSGDIIVGLNGELVDEDGNPILGPNGELLGPGGISLRGPNGELLFGDDRSLIGTSAEGFGSRPLIGSDNLSGQFVGDGVFISGEGADISGLLGGDTRILGSNSGFFVFNKTPQESLVTPISGPNFNNTFTNDNYEVSDNLSNDDFNTEITGSNYEIINYLTKTGIDLAIDYSDFSNFINFSSAETRLDIFKDKLDNIKSYEESISNIEASPEHTSVSISTFKNLIKTEIEGFDHYEKHLFFSSGSTAWPKSGSVRPYEILDSSESEAITFYTTKKEDASLYDVNNRGRLVYTIPSFIRDDEHNEKYVHFVNMIAQEVDNIWIYIKAITDRYNADNRLDRGISAELAKEAVESLGFKLSTNSLIGKDLYSLVVNNTYQSGSEEITEVVTALSGSAYEYLQGVSGLDYEGEIYKRIYHNIPLLTKGKGTSKSYRALLNCFGISPDIVPIKMASFSTVSGTDYFGPDVLDTDLSGSIYQNDDYKVISNSPAVLSNIVSILRPLGNVRRGNKSVEIGFGLNDSFDNLSISSSYTNGYSYDDSVGDPRIFNTSKNKYSTLEEKKKIIIQNENISENIRKNSDFIRSIKFFDKSAFNAAKSSQAVKNSNSTGIVVKQSILDRNKHRIVSASYETTVYTGSYEVVDGTLDHTTNYTRALNYTSSFVSSEGVDTRIISSEEISITGELSGSYIRSSDGELNRSNTSKKVNQPLIQYDIEAFRLTDSFTTEDFIHITPTGSTINVLVSSSVLIEGAPNQITSVLEVNAITISNSGLLGNYNKLSISQADTINFRVVDGNSSYDFNNKLVEKRDFSDYTAFTVMPYFVGSVVNDYGVPFSTASPNPEISDGGTFTGVSGSQESSINLQPYSATLLRNSDFNPLQGTVNIQRSNRSQLIIDKQNAASEPTNINNLLSGSGTFGTVPQSNYTSTGYSRGRYKGTLETSRNIEGNEPYKTLAFSEGIIVDRTVNAQKIIDSTTATSTIVYFEPYKVTGSVIDSIADEFVFNELPSISGSEMASNSSYLYTFSDNSYKKVENKKVYFVNTNKVYATNDKGRVVSLETGSV